MHPAALTCWTAALVFLFTTPVQARILTVEDQDPMIQYLPTTAWGLVNSPGLSASGTHMMSSDPTAVASFRFTFRKMEVWGSQWPYPVASDISIDGQHYTVDFQDYSIPERVGGPASVAATALFTIIMNSNVEHAITVSMHSPAPYFVLDIFTFEVDDEATSSVTFVDSTSTTISTSLSHYFTPTFPQTSPPFVSSSDLPSPSPSSTTTSASTATSAPATTNASSKPKVLLVIIGAIVGAFSLLSLIFMLLFCRRRRRRRQKAPSTKHKLNGDHVGDFPRGYRSVQASQPVTWTPPPSPPKAVIDAPLPLMLPNPYDTASQYPSTSSSHMSASSTKTFRVRNGTQPSYTKDTHTSDFGAPMGLTTLEWRPPAIDPFNSYRGLSFVSSSASSALLTRKSTTPYVNTMKIAKEESSEAEASLSAGHSINAGLPPPPYTGTGIALSEGSWPKDFKQSR